MPRSNNILQLGATEGKKIYNRRRRITDGKQTSGAFAVIEMSILTENHTRNEIY